MIRKGVTDRELEVVAAWWHSGSVVEAARFLVISEQTAKNLLHTARLRSGAPTTLALSQMFMADLPSVVALRRRTKQRANRRTAA